MYKKVAFKRCNKVMELTNKDSISPGYTLFRIRNSNIYSAEE